MQRTQNSPKSKGSISSNMTEFKVEAVRIGNVARLENSESLSITNIHGGYPCIFRTGDFSEGELAAYIPVDALCPVARQEFKFLDSGKGRAFERIKARRLRGTFSMGLLVKAPAGAKEGDDLRAHFGVEKWEPPSEREDSRPAKNIKRSTWFSRVWRGVLALLRLAPPPAPHVPVYDIDGIRKHMNLLHEGESVVITEKIHGCNARYLHTGKRFYVGSRTMFRQSGPSVWHDAAEKYKLESIMRQYPGAVLFGEVYGSVQDLKYGVPASEGVRFAVFDVLWENRNSRERVYLDYDALLRFCSSHGLPVVPELYRGPWNTTLLSLAEGKSTLPGANHVREGFVVRPVVERRNANFGRVQLKMHGEGYLTRKEQD